MNGLTLGILGVGAIGGSIAMRARRNGAHVTGADCDTAALEDARKRGAIDAVETAQELAHRVEVLIIATHLPATLREIERLAASPPSNAVLVMDVASVKVPVMRAAASLRKFVGTHPMAGTECAGVAAARAGLFENRTWAYVPSGESELDARAWGFIESMGAVPFAISAEEHDRVVALTSHLPQLLAACYARQLRANDGNAENLCGPVARELLRISGMSFAMWRDIFEANAHNIEPQLRALVDDVSSVADGLAKSDIDGLAPLFGGAD